MDFFEAQARAKKSTSRLVALFALAVLGTVLGGYGAAVFALRQTHDDNPRRSSRSAQRSTLNAPLPSWWQPQLFLGVSSLTLAVVGLASLYKWSEFSAGGSAVAESVGGRRVDPHTTDTIERRLLNVVEEMAIASGVPVPAVYIMDEEPAINAFAAGLTTSDAVVAVTRGTLEKLSREELQGVVGHEFSHILNGDMRLNMRLTALVFGILFLGLAGRGILWTLRFQSLGGSRDREGKNSGGMLIAIGFVGLALLILGYVGYFFGRLIQAAVSRQREYLADASAVQFTRNPGGLSGALKKIGGFTLGSSIQSNQSGAIGHFFFAQGFRSHFGGLWATHPPLDERIRAIDPQFDGQMSAPPEVVDFARDSFVTAGLAPAQPSRTSHLAHPPATPAAAAIAAVGTLTSDQISNAQLLLDSTPARLRAATQTPAEAQVLLYGLLLDEDPATRARQRSLVASRSGGDALRTLDELTPSLAALGLAHVPEGRQVFKSMTIAENLEMGAYSVSGRQRKKEAVERAYALFPVLAERRRSQAGTLSGGQQQMLAIGRALASSPRLLLLDEPSLGLSPLMADEMFAHIGKAHAIAGVTVMLVEQRVAESLESCDRAYVLDSGRITLEGPPQTLLRDPRIRATYMGIAAVAQDSPGGGAA